MLGVAARGVGCKNGKCGAPGCGDTSSARLHDSIADDAGNNIGGRGIL